MCLRDRTRTARASPGTCAARSSCGSDPPRPARAAPDRPAAGRSGTSGPGGLRACGGRRVAGPRPPGRGGTPATLVEESHGAAGLLEYPGYTKPPEWDGLEVPDVLLSGHHARIRRWRRDQALRRTARRRPDMVRALDVAALDRHDLEVLAGAGWGVVDGHLERTAPADG